MRMKDLPRHGQSKHPHFRRWGSIVQRCYNPNSPHWRDYGGRGIRVDWRWHPLNSSGVKNFLAWVDYEVTGFWLRHPSRQGERIEVARKDVNKDFSAKNCTIAFEGSSAQNRRGTLLNVEMVVAMRRYKRQRPDLSMHQMVLLFELDQMAIYRALRGLTWKCANAIEPPLPRWYKTNKEQGKEHEVV